MEATYTPFTDSGVASIYFSCEKENASRCIELMDRQLGELAEALLPSLRASLSVAKRQFLGQLAISAENNESYMLGAAKSYLVFGDVDGFGEAKEKIEALDGETLRTVAEEVFTGMSALIYK